MPARGSAEPRLKGAAPATIDLLDKHVDAGGLHGAADALPGLDDAEPLPHGERQTRVGGRRRRRRLQRRLRVVPLALLLAGTAPHRGRVNPERSAGRGRGGRPGSGQTGSARGECEVRCGQISRPSPC